MAKIRLNQDKRYVLKQHAKALVQKTPVDKGDFNKAMKECDAVRAKMYAACVQEINKKYPPKDVDTLLELEKKYASSNSYTSCVCNVMLKDKESGASFSDVFEFFDNSIERLKPEYQDPNKARAAASSYHDKKAKYAVKVPKTPYMHETMTIMADRKLWELGIKWKAATEKLRAEHRALEQATREVLDALYALIDSSRYFEDVVDVWPEAKDVAGKVIPDGTSIALLSDDAIAKIKENMKARGYKNSA